VTKRYDDPIDVTTDPVDDGAPLSFKWRGRRYLVDQRLASWREDGGWWDADSMRAREYHRVIAHRAGALATGDLDADGFMASRGAAVGGPQDQMGAVFDVYKDWGDGAWRLARVWD
jgi:hypothetical protein